MKNKVNKKTVFFLLASTKDLWLYKAIITLYYYIFNTYRHIKQHISGERLQL